MPEKTGKKHALTPEMEAKKWEVGKSGNPAGRPKGSRNALSEAFIHELHKDFTVNGTATIKELRETDPGAYIRAIASIVPKEFTINEGETSIERLLEQLTDSQLAEAITGLQLLGHAAGKGTKETAVKTRPDQVH